MSHFLSFVTGADDNNVIVWESKARRGREKVYLFVLF